MAERLDEFAALLELAGASYYSARAYGRAAELVRAAPVSVAQLVQDGRVRELRGIGPVDRGAAARADRDRRPRRSRRAAARPAARARGARPAARHRRASARPRSARRSASRPSSDFRTAAEAGTPARGARHRPEDGDEDPRRPGARADARARGCSCRTRARSPRASPPRSAASPRAMRGAGSTTPARLAVVVGSDDPAGVARVSRRCPRSSRCSTRSRASRRRVRCSSSSSRRRRAGDGARPRDGPAEHVAALGALPAAPDEPTALCVARPRRFRRPRSATASPSERRRRSC